MGTSRKGCLQSPRPPRRQSGSASTSPPHHRQRQLTLEPFFLASLPGFLHAQGKHLQAATRNSTAGHPPGNGTTPSSLLAATKKLGGALWAPYARGAYTPLHTMSTARDTQYHVTSPEPVSLSNVYSSHNLHMYTLNKISTLLPLVLITSYCVGTSTTAPTTLSAIQASSQSIFITEQLYSTCD